MPEIYLKKFLLQVDPELANLSPSELTGIDNSLEQVGIYEGLENSQRDGHRLLKHGLGVGKLAYRIARHSGFSSQDSVAATVGGIIHDSGKALTSPKYSEHDSIDLEAKLREVGQNDLGQAIRHNPSLFLEDFRNGRLSKAQVAVTIADAYVDGSGEYTCFSLRQEDILQRKQVSPIIQRSLGGLLLQPGVAMSGVSGARQHIRFIERFDGRYPVSKDPATHGKISSFQIAKNLVDMGFNTSIMAYIQDGDRFQTDGVTFLGPEEIKNIDSYVKPEEIVFVSGWTSGFQRMQDRFQPSTLVMRSLLRNSLTQERLTRIQEAGKACILLNSASAEVVGTHEYTRIPNGYDPEIFRFFPAEIKKQIIFAGAVVPEKGFDHLQRIARNLPEFEFIVAGSSNMYGREEQSVDLPSNVTRIGEVDQKTLAELYRSSCASIFLTDPTRIFEVFGKSAMEATLCGCPLIYVNNGGLASTIQQHRLTRGIDIESIDTLSSEVFRMSDLAYSSDLRASLANQAQRHNLTWRQVSARFLTRGLDSVIDSSLKFTETLSAEDSLEANTRKRAVRT